MSRHSLRPEGKGLGGSLRNRGSVRHRHRALLPRLVFLRMAVGFWARLVSPGVVLGRVDVAQVRPAMGAVEQEDLPSLGWLRVWRQRVSVCPHGRCQEAGWPRLGPSSLAWFWVNLWLTVLCLGNP